MSVRDTIVKKYPRVSEHKKVLCFVYGVTLRCLHVKQRLYKDKISDLNYVTLHSRFLRKYLGNNSKIYLKALEELGILEFVYIGKNARGYYTIAIKPIQNKLRSIGIDKDLQERAQELFRKYVEKYSSKDETAIIIRKNLARANFNGEPVNTCTDKDGFSGRYHHCLTVVSNRRRLSDIRIDGEHVAEIDVKQCQIQIFANILEVDEMGKSLVDFMASDNDLYKHMQSKFNLPSRKKAKKLVLAALFGRDDSKKSKMLYSAFPDVKKAMIYYKTIIDKDNPSRKIYSNLCKITQGIEVEFLKDLAFGLEFFEIPFIPVHDSVLVKESDLDQAESIFKDSLDKYIPNAKYKINFAPGRKEKYLEKMKKELEFCV